MRNIFHLLKNVMKRINDMLAKLCGILLLMIVVLLTVNVVTRAIGSPIPGLMSLSVLIMVIVVYLGLSSAEENDDHATVDIVPTILPPKWARINSIIVKLLSLVAISIFFYKSVFSFIKSYQLKEVIADVVSIYIWPSKVAISIGLLFFAIAIALKLFEDIEFLATSKNTPEQNND